MTVLIIAIASAIIIGMAAALGNTKK